MLDRRRHARGRVYYGGRIAFNGRGSTMDCIVRNFSDAGAKVEFAYPTLFMGQVDLTVQRKGLAFLARMVWRRKNEVGFAFSHPRPVQEAMSLDWALRLRASERANRALRRQNAELRSGY
ncbi:hypothetical protein BH11PSE4_BH11PSE4_16030 [soil metagenome]